MGPVGAAMGAFNRINRGMENRAQSILKRRPNLKHHATDQQKPGRKFKAKDYHRYQSKYTVLRPINRVKPLLISLIACSVSGTCLIVGIPAALTPAPYPVFRDDVVSDLACVLVVCVPAVAASFVSLVYYLERARKSH